MLTDITTGTHFDNPISFFQLDGESVQAPVQFDWHHDYDQVFEFIGKPLFDPMEYFMGTRKKITIDLPDISAYKELPPKSPIEIEINDLKLVGVVTRRDYKRNRLHIIGDFVNA